MRFGLDAILGLFLLSIAAVGVKFVEFHLFQHYMTFAEAWHALTPFALCVAIGNASDRNYQLSCQNVNEA